MSNESRSERYHVPPASCEMPWRWSTTPGASGTGSGTLQRGTYTLVCILGNHEELGMYGTLTVR